MNTLAGRVQMISDLYDKGFLCDCQKEKRRQLFEVESEVIIEHSSNCNAKDKVKDLIELAGSNG